MKKLVVLTIILIHGFYSKAQQFQLVQSLDIPSGYTGKSLHWLDMNHDGELDIIVQATDEFDYCVFLIYKNENKTLALADTIETGIQNAVFSFTDINMDGMVDVVLSGDADEGPLTTALISNGDFSFSLLDEPLLPISGSVIKFADLNQNGVKELMISGTNTDGLFFSIFELQEDGWVLANDSIKVLASFIEVHDFNQDGTNDLFISGQLENTSSYHAILINDQSINFTEEIPIPDIYEVSPYLADLNYDGIFDVIMAGVNDNNEGIIHALISEADSFAIKEITLLDFIPKNIFVADLDSDGQVDIQVQGEDQAATPVNKIILTTESTELLESNNLITQRFGDFDYDGDLDLVQLSGDSPQTINIYRNTHTNINSAPTVPSSPIAVILYDRLIMHWNKSTDDLTPQSSITYDVTIQIQDKDIVSGNFDALNKRRLQVVHGNNGTKNFALFDNFNYPDFAFHIQSIDNAFHAGEYSCSGGKTCLEIQEEELLLCKTEGKTLHAEDNALWFSLTRGFLGEGPSYEYEPDATDTVFYLMTNIEAVCVSAKIFLPERKDILVAEYDNNTLFACENSQLQFESNDDWAQVEWSSFNNGFLSNELTITYTVTATDTVKLLVTNGEGCTEIHRTPVAISKPVITLNGQSFQILKGEEVQLNASGGTQYAWSPSTGLSNSTIVNPTASPTVTTTYTVTVTDSIGCTASASVLVVVQSQAFIPNLFTPNQDGTNDQLKIYGLSQVKDFSFVIVNREGNVVYSTSDVTEATQQGWDGSVKGVLQPGGVYYWKVNGQLLNGSKLLLNGKDSGSIVLIR